MAEEFDPAVHSHHRYHPLTGDWILVSDPHHMKHPWHGQVKPPESEFLPEHDPSHIFTVTIVATEPASLKCYANNPGVVSSEAPRGPFNRPCLLRDYILSEDQGRVVVRNEHFVALVPCSSDQSFSLTVLPYHRHTPSLVHLTKEEKLSLGSLLSRVTKRYNLFSCSFAYSMGRHQRPLPAHKEGIQNADEENIPHLHLLYFPPLLRSATVRRFFVGIVAALII